ncbi:MAG: hypothetical protein N3E38_01230 [Candidatus Aenigmarchaeota archaeon]|nr:hypothetical protein [Candidatus Aenigmarchaeota archaeon]
MKTTGKLITSKLKKIIMRKFLVLFIIFALVYAQDYQKLKYFYLPKEIILQEGSYNESFIIVENTHSETIFLLSLKYEALPNFDIISKEIEELNPKERKAIRFNVSSTKEGLYNLTVWVESINEINGVRIQSQKVKIPIIVLKPLSAPVEIKNVTINTTTTAISKTTSIQSMTSPENILTTTIVYENKTKINPRVKTILIILLIALITLIFLKMFK